jgi:hypothetical protein
MFSAANSAFDFIVAGTSEVKGKATNLHEANI